MEDPYLYQRISQSVRQQILRGDLKPGDRLPSIRIMAKKWKCTAGTIQHAYQELTQQGLIESHTGQGTKVVEDIPAAPSLETPLRRAALVHRAESYLLEMLTTGFNLAEIEDALRQAMDRWRSVDRQPFIVNEEILNFIGSHDLVITWLASHFEDIAPGYSLNLQFAGSIGGLIALAEGKADLAGSHLWDEESNTFNIPFIHRILPGRRVAVVTLAHRRLGLIVPPGNPRQIQGLADLSGPGLRFVNRQQGSGTRVWLDCALSHLGILAAQISGYDNEKTTHSAVARAIAEGDADVGIGLEAAARSYGLDFIFLRHDRYDLVIPQENMQIMPIAALIDWLSSEAAKIMITNLGGYDVEETGELIWV